MNKIEFSNFKYDSIKFSRKLLSTYLFSFDGLELTIAIKIYSIYDEIDNVIKYQYEQSHFIYSSIQGSPYYPSNNIETSEIKALEMAVFNLRSYYEAAIKANATPTNSWFVVNKSF